MVGSPDSEDGLGARGRDSFAPASNGRSVKGAIKVRLRGTISLSSPGAKKVRVGALKTRRPPRIRRGQTLTSRHPTFLTCDKGSAWESPDSGIAIPSQDSEFIPHGVAGGGSWSWDKSEIRFHKDIVAPRVINGSHEYREVNFVGEMTDVN